MLSTLPEKMHAGMLATYSMRPACRVPVTWVSEILEYEESVRFLDVQRRGPYALWRHEHRFREVPGGVEMDDHVDYALPMGALAEPVHLYLVRPQLARIFEYRRRTIEALFGRIPD